MISFKRRLASAALAAALATSFGIEASWAQGATVGPAGGAPSNSAPSNSEGTPSGGTGRVSTTVAPSAPMASTTPHRTVRHRRATRRTHRAPAASDTSQ